MIAISERTSEITMKLSRPTPPKKQRHGRERREEGEPEAQHAHVAARIALGPEDLAARGA